MLDMHSRLDTGIQVIRIAQVRVNPKKLRKLSAAKIDQYMLDYDYGCEFPPIIVEHCGDFYVVRDGRHRFQAQLHCGFSYIEVSVYN